MGDRANVVVFDEPDVVFLYTHWYGTELPATLHAALSRRLRWHHGPYLARIIFQEMVGDDVSDTGYGISTEIGDNEYDLLVCDCVSQRVYRYPERIYRHRRLETLAAHPSVAFEDYIAVPRTWDNLTEVGPCT